METFYADMTGGIDPILMEKAGKIIRNGGLVAFPTETVYGLGANALDPEASAKIYKAKGRPSDNPLIVHVAEYEDLYKIAVNIPAEAKKLANAFWPGPLTMIFRAGDAVPRRTTGGLDTVAVRMPSHPAALALIRAGGGFIAAPSANASGRPSPTKAEHVMQDLSGRIDMVIDGGDVGIGLESTIIDLTEEVPTVLRPGYISIDMLRDVIGDVCMDPGLIEDLDPGQSSEAETGQGSAMKQGQVSEAETGQGSAMKQGQASEAETGQGLHPKAPGMKYRHYAPKGDLVVVEGSEADVIRYINEHAGKDLAEGYKVGILASDESISRYENGIVRSAGTRHDENTIAMHLYALLREFDDLGMQKIYSEAFQTPQLGQAIMNRLIKAAGHQVIRL